MTTTRCVFSIETPSEHRGLPILSACEILRGERFTLYRGKHVLFTAGSEAGEYAKIAETIERVAAAEVDVADLRVGTEFWIEGSDPAKGIMIALRSRPAFSEPEPVRAKSAPLPTFVSLGFASAHLTAEQSAREDDALGMFKDLAEFIAAGPSSRLTSLAMTSLQESWVLFREANAEPSIAGALAASLAESKASESPVGRAAISALDHIPQIERRIGKLDGHVLQTTGATVEERALDLDRKTRPR